MEGRGVMKSVIGLMVVLGMSLSGAVAGAQGSDSEPNALKGLAVNGIGRVAASAVQPNARGIEVGAIPANSAETAVTDATTEVATPKPEGRIDSATLNREIEARFKALNHCRIDVARHKQRPLAGIVADSLTLRWTILATGDVALSEVVATTPVDGNVMDCVARDVRRWHFTPPTGGTLRLERVVTFRPGQK
jgi:hypothetical protein